MSTDGARDSGRFLASGDESGSAPGDRPFRPDVEGLRGLAILLVVLFHAGAGFNGGYIGVDVFFVISGFVITGVLLRERRATGKTSILGFYGRRCRRILPVATLVIAATVALAYLVLGGAAGARTAGDGRWASVFLANFHFGSTGTDYLTAHQPPSLVQNYWSLAVEEQFYLVYPGLFVLVATLGRRWSVTARLIGVLLPVIGASFAFSVIDTIRDAPAAYFSPFTRGWELALGALVAVATPWLRALPNAVAVAAGWVGLGGVLVGGTAFGPHTPYPGSLVALPVAGAALIIAAGAAKPRWGVEAFLGSAPSRWLGKVSYSLYLWHWPVLMLATQHASRNTLPVVESLGWVAVALVLAVATYIAVENPIRHSRALASIRWRSLGLGAALIAVTIAVVTAQSALVSAPSESASAAVRTAVGSTGRQATLKAVLSQVAASDRIENAPPGLQPSLEAAFARPLWNIGFPSPSDGCAHPLTTPELAHCWYGDPHGRQTVVLYGDSHAGMWARAMIDIAKRARWRLLVLYFPGCPTALMPTHPPNLRGRWTICDEWHAFVPRVMNRLRPQLLVITQASNSQSPTGATYSSAALRRGVGALLDRLRGPRQTVVLGSPPVSGGPDCLAEHAAAISTCDGSPLRAFNADQRLAAIHHGARFLDITPWFCHTRCPSVIGAFNAYYDPTHVSAAYARYLEGVLSTALATPPG